MRTTIRTRLRATALAAVMAITSFAVTAVPGTPRPADPADDPLGAVLDTLTAALAPDVARAGWCASVPSFTGYLTASSGSTTAITRITNPDVYGYISDVDAAWSCTNAFRYSALAWNINATEGRFNWGNLINSTSVSCNWAVSSTDYLKANSTNDCADSDAEYAMEITLDGQRQYNNNAAHTAEGQFSWAHTDCGTYYGVSDPNELGERHKTNESFSTSNVDNRPGSNCDPIVLDNTGVSQTVIYDATAPAVAFDAPLGGPTTVTSATTTVQFDATDGLAGFGGANGWTLTRQVAPWTGSACGSFVTDTGGAVTTGTGNAANQTVTQYLPAAACYRWTLSATDQNGNTATTVTSGTIRRTTDALLGLGGYQHFESWDLGAGDTLSVNAATGNVVVSHPVVSLPIRGGVFDLAMTYNSADPTSVGMGPGWRLNVQRGLTIDGSGNVTFTDADGARHTFTNPSGSGTVTYTRPSTLYANLVRNTGPNPDTFTLTYRDQSVDEFAELAANTGYLTKQRDRHGNAVTFTYSGTTLTTATDPAGRTVGFTWSSGQLTAITDWANVNVSTGVVQASGSGNRVHDFFYSGGLLTGWDRPLAGGGACPTAAAHRVCLTYANGLLTEISRQQTYTTLVSGALTPATRTPTPKTVIAYRGGDIASLTDAEGAATTFTRPAAGQLAVTRPGTPASVTTYGLVCGGDTLARVQSIWRTLGGSQIERRFAYSGSYPIEPFKVTDNYVNGTAGDGNAHVEDRIVEYAYTTMGLVARITEPLDGTYTRWTDYTYNANYDVTQKIVSRQGSTDPDHSMKTTYTWGGPTGTCSPPVANAVLRTVVENHVNGTKGDGAANVEDVTTTYETDCAGQRTFEQRFNYTVAGGSALDSRVLAWTYDTYGNVTSEIANDTVSTTYDEDPDPANNARTNLTTVHAYDTAGNRIATGDPRCTITKGGTCLTADDHYVTRSVYDAHNRRTAETSPTTPGITITQKTSTTVYDEYDLVRHVTDFGDLETATLYDRVGRATATYEDPDGSGGTAALQTSATTYDASGRVLTAKDRRQVGGVGGETQTTYDALGRTLSVKEGVVSGVAVSVTAYGYDALDRRLTEETGQGSGTGQLTTYTYDLGGRTTKIDDEFTCAATTYDYRDLAKTVSEGLDPTTCTGTAQRVITHEYDRLGRRTSSEITAGEGDNDILAASTYDAAGRALTSSATKAGATTASAFTHNPLDQLIAEIRSDAGTAVSWTKTNADPAGNPTDRCVWNTNPGAELCKPVGQSFTTVPSVHATTAYDARNGRTSLKIPGSGETTYDPDHNYAVDLVYLPTRLNGSNEVIAEHRTDYGYDNRHRLISIGHSVCPVTAATHTCTATAVTTGSVTYAYDDNDNRTRVNEANGAGSLDRYYCYDGLNRLVSTRTATGCSTGLHETYEYDAAGNRTRATLSSPAYFRYSPAGQLCEQAASLAACPGDPSTWAIRYDDTGRTSLWAGWTLTYDGEGRLATACKAAVCATGDMVTMRYDAAGRRVELVTRPNGQVATVVTFRYQGDAIAQELTDGTVSRTYVTDEAGGIVKICDPDCSGSNPQYLVTWNGHGDAQALWQINSDGTLTIANTYTYSTWGTPTTTTHTEYGDLSFRFLYVGRYGVAWDNAFSLGLAHMGVRHYSPALGRFLQPDPSALEANLYAYGANSPVTKVDPSGLLFEDLNPRERGYCSLPWNWGACLVAQEARVWAWRETRRWYRGFELTGGKGDAFRHCCWSAALTISLGGAKARHITDDLHELGDPRAGWADRRMDLYNNSRGRIIGSSIAIRFRWSPQGSMPPIRVRDSRAMWSDAARLCRSAITRGQLMWFYHGDPPRTLA